MSSTSEQTSTDLSSCKEQSTLVRFFDGLFQEQNIKWLLGLGTLILLSSSTMLVTSHWDTYTPLWKYFVLLAYTATFHVAGQIAYHQLSLRKTGTGLMAVTVMLIPLSFAAFRWIHPATVLSLNGLLEQTGLLVLLVMNSLFSFLAVRRIFTFFLRKNQPTFLASYLILAGLGAILPALPVAAAPLMTGFSWVVFAIGSMKVNRHAFWLAEEFRKPRVFGFFPIILLGTQFLTLFATTLAPHVPVEWIGFGLLLTAIPILLAADALAAVIQARSEAITPVLAPSVIVSMILGSAVVLGGVFLSAYHFPATVAIVPTSLLAAIVFGVVARRTRRTELVWLMLLLFVTAYQTCPVFFKEVARQLLQQSAAMVGESRMPFAFYGVTYLPLLGVTTLSAVWLNARNQHLFAIPFKQISCWLPMLLIIISFGHEKALLPVSLALGILLTLQTFLFQDRRMQFAVLAAFLAITLGTVPFLSTTMEIQASFPIHLLSWIVATGLLMAVGRTFDDFMLTFPPSSSVWAATHVAQKASLILLIGIASSWTLNSLFVRTVDTLELGTGLLCWGMLVRQAILLKRNSVIVSESESKSDTVSVNANASALIMSCLALTFPIFLGWSLARFTGWSISSQFLLLSGYFAGLSIAAGLSKRRRDWTLSQVFGRSCEGVSTFGVVLLQALFVPEMFLSILGHNGLTLWGAASITLLNSLFIAYRLHSTGFTILTWLNLLAFTGAYVVEGLLFAQAILFVPAIWAGMSSVLALLVRVKNPLLPQLSQAQRSLLNNIPNVQRELIEEYSTIEVQTQRQNSLLTLEWCLGATLACIALLTLPFFQAPLRIAALIAISGLLVLVIGRRTPQLTDIVLGLTNCQLLVFIIQQCSPGIPFLFDFRPTDTAIVALPVALVSALSALFWESRRREESWFVHGASLGFQGLCYFSLIMFLPVNQHAPHVVQLLFSLLTFAVLIGIHTLHALRNAALLDELDPKSISAEDQRKLTTFHVWYTEALLLFAVGYVWLLNLIEVPVTVGLFGPLFLSGFAWFASLWSHQRRRWSIFSGPLRATSTMLPALTVFVGICQFGSGVILYWPGVNSLALLLVSGFYYWRGQAERHTGCLITSVLTLNIALATLWNDLHWTDPQLFLVPIGISILLLVEALKLQIPGTLHNPLRYAGALTILVSPTFEIVGGSWVHLITLMVTSIVIVVIAMGLRVKALMYTGTAFLIADLIAIVVRGTIDQPSLLWLAGIAVGVGVIGLAAYCERHREQMLQRMRSLAAQLETWE